MDIRRLNSSFSVAQEDIRIFRMPPPGLSQEKRIKGTTRKTEPVRPKAFMALIKEVTKLGMVSMPSSEPRVAPAMTKRSFKLRPARASW
ncbi:MAG: hypothetical protein BWY80_00265 [Firmicutes bacterium ADurb.Bin456]|nr:MAG: hypothetical protein BWY80_00265 [Firmicutes bacterium ADurb.Bin456]